MTTISLRLDDETKSEIDNICESLGLNITTFFMIYAKKAIRERGIPFSMNLGPDMFYSESNQKALNEAYKQYDNGEVVTKTMKDLEKIANA